MALSKGAELEKGILLGRQVVLADGIFSIFASGTRKNSANRSPADDENRSMQPAALQDNERLACNTCCMGMACGH
jgi:hypothetical protein